MHSSLKSPGIAASTILLLLANVAAQDSAPSRINSPLVVTRHSHVVVMEYEAWFGPNAVTFAGSAAKPLIQSADMQALGGGYDSADPAVIGNHVALMEYMGIDAAILDLTNNVSCIFNSEAFIKRYKINCPSDFRLQNQTIRNNTGNLYPAWSALSTPLKLIPLLGGIDQDVLFRDTDGKTSLEKEIQYFGDRIAAHPNLAVEFDGKPLMLIFLGAAQDPSTADNPLWLQIRNFLNAHPSLRNKYTFRMMAGYLDSQPSLWTSQAAPTGPVQIAQMYSFWSWVDRLNPTCTEALCPYFPSYNVTGGTNSRVENFTVSIATAGQSGWGCPNENSLPYCPDDALRFTGEDRSYGTFDSFMSYARALDPIFLLIHQFNEFTPGDEGFNGYTDDDIEPADLWGHGAVKSVRYQIKLYREHVAASSAK